MEDIVKIKSIWGNAIISKIISKALKKAGYDMMIDIHEIEAANDDDGDNVKVDALVTVRMNKDTINKLLK